MAYKLSGAEGQPIPLQIIYVFETKRKKLWFEIEYYIIPAKTLRAKTRVRKENFL